MLRFLKHTTPPFSTLELPGTDDLDVFASPQAPKAQSRGQPQKSCWFRVWFIRIHDRVYSFGQPTAPKLIENGCPNGFTRLVDVNVVVLLYLLLRRGIK